MKFRFLSASSKAITYYLIMACFILLGVVFMCSSNWYVIKPSECEDSKDTGADDFTYEVKSTSNMLIKLYYGACSEQNRCILWDDLSDWDLFDRQNLKIYGYETDLVTDAKNIWNFIFALSILVLIGNGLLVLSFIYFAWMKKIDIEYQITAGIFHILLGIVASIAVGYGLATDTILPTSWSTYYYNCNVYTSPGIGWWGCILSIFLNYFCAILVLFPYLIGPDWVFVHDAESSAKVQSSEDIIASQDSSGGLSVRSPSKVL